MPINDSGRSYHRSYSRVQRRVHHDFVEQAIVRSGGRVLTSTGGQTAPLFLGVETGDGDRFAVCVYAFLANRRETHNRPPDEHRLQIRYGDVNSAAWRRQHHPIGFDPLGADVTMVIGVHIEAGLVIGLDPLIYDPLPLGISIEFKDAEIQDALRRGWHVWERDNVSGARRGSPRAALGIETIIAFTPNRLVDYLRFERDSQALRLDPPLRFARAVAASDPQSPHGIHALEDEFALPAAEILDLISERPRLGTAVRGGVAERHLEKQLDADSEVNEVAIGTTDGPPDFIVVMASGEEVTVECKNASVKPYADGTAKVEAQKTRASKGDPKSRLYDESQFNVLAASLFPPFKRWEFRYKRSSELIRDFTYPDRIAALQRIDESWSTTLADALGSHESGRRQ